MDFSLSEQMWCLFCSLICGLLVGALYDFFRIIRHLIFTSNLSVFVCDFLFVMFFAFISVFFSMAFARGNTRYFIIMGELSGFLVYRFTFGRITLPFAEFLISKLRVIFKKILIKSKKISKKVLQPVYKLLYNTNRKRMSFSKRLKSKTRGKR